MTQIPYGSVVSWKVPPKNNSFLIKIFGYLQFLFTDGKETHSSIIMSRYPEVDAYYEYELSVTARINVFHPNKNATVFEILAPLELKIGSLSYLIKKTYGDIYALWQTPMFAVRKLVELLGFDGRRLWNPFSWLGICGEGVYEYLYRIAIEESWVDLMEYMNEWNPDLFNSHDTRLVLDYMVSKNYGKVIE